MSHSSLPEDLQILAAGYVLGDLNSEETIQFQQLLVVYPGLSKMVSSLQETLSLLPYGLPPQTPSGEARSRLLHAASDREKASQTPLSRLSKITPKWLPSATRLAVPVALGLGGCSFWLGYRVVTLQAQLATAEQFVEMAMADDQTVGPTLTVSPADTVLREQWPGLAQLVQDHRESLGQSQGPVEVATASPETLLAQLPWSQPLSTITSPQVKLLGGSHCEFGQAKGLRLTYELPAEQTVSLYQIDLNGDQFPEFLETYVTLRDQNVNLVFWREEDRLYALTAEVPLTDLQTLAQTLESI